MGKTFEIPALADVLEALGLETTEDPHYAIRDGVDFRMRWGGTGRRQFSSVTVQLKAGGYRGTRRAVTLHKGCYVDTREDTVARRPLNDSEKAKLAERFEELKRVADYAEKEQEREQERRRKKNERQKALAKAMPTRFKFDEDGSGYPRGADPFNPIQVSLNSETVTVPLKDMTPEAAESFVSQVEMLFAEHLSDENNRETK